MQEDLNFQNFTIFLHFLSVFLSVRPVKQSSNKIFPVG